MADDTGDRQHADELVHYGVADHVATLTLDSPHNRNALSSRLVGQLHEGLARAEQDDDARAVVVRATGRTFCSGADLSEATSGGMEQTARGMVDLQRRIVAHPKPVVVRAHGNVRAGGIGLVAAADIAVSADDASYALTEVRLGLAAAAVSLTVLPRLTDRAAGWAFLSGDVFDGRAAERMGLVTRSVPEEDLDLEVDEICASLAKGSPQGLREAKRLLAAPLLERIDAQADDMASLSARLFGSDEARERMLAFLRRKG
jgi:enoyl-CoA hydratase/methylglutaconyl-CoA hydratase